MRPISAITKKRCAIARQDTLARQQAVDAVRNGGLDLNGNPPVVSALLDGELAHALRVQAALELRNGNNAGAQAAAEKALYIITAHPDLPLAWRADMVELMADINARQGRVVFAERQYIDALAMNRKLFGDGGPTIQNLLQLGRFYSDEQIYPSAIASYREAFALLAKDPLTRSQVVTDQIIPFITAANASLGGADRAKLEAEMFAASQMTDSGVAGQTIARMAARRARHAGLPACRGSACRRRCEPRPGRGAYGAGGGACQDQRPARPQARSRDGSPAGRRRLQGR